MLQIISKMGGKAAPKAVTLLKNLFTKCSGRFAGFIAKHPKIWKVTKFMGSVAAWAGIDWLITKAVSNDEVPEGEIKEEDVLEYVDSVLGFLPDVDEVFGDRCVSAVQAITVGGSSVSIGRAIDATTELTSSLACDSNLSLENATRLGAIDLYLRRLKVAGLSAHAALPDDAEMFKILSWYVVALIEEMEEADPEHAEFYERFIQFHFSDGDALSDEDIALVRALGLPDTSSEDDPAGRRLGNHFYYVCQMFVQSANLYDESDLCTIELSLMYAYLVCMARRAANGKDVTVLFS